MHERPRSDAPTAESIAAGHETSDIKLRPILVSGVWLVGVTVIVLLLLWGLMGVFEHRDERTDPLPSPVASFRQQPPNPRLQPLYDLHNTTPAQDWLIMKRQNEQALNQLSWVDRQAQVARIPIDDAMRIVAQRGLPARSSAPATQGVGQ